MENKTENKNENKTENKEKKQENPFLIETPNKQEFDLSKILNFSFDINLLKNLLESLIQNQIETKSEIEKIKRGNMGFYNNIENNDYNNSNNNVVTESLEVPISKQESLSNKINIKLNPLPSEEIFQIKVSPSNGDNINNIIKKLHVCYTTCETLYRGFGETKKKINSQTDDSQEMKKKITEQEEIIETLRTKVDEHENKLKDLEVKVQDFNIAELLKLSVGNDGDSNLAYGLINNLEKKMMLKFKFIDEKIAKIDELTIKSNKDIKDVKNAQSLNLRTMDTLKKNNEDINNTIDELFKKLDNNISEINEKYEPKINEIDNNVKEIQKRLLVIDDDMNRNLRELKSSKRLMTEGSSNININEIENLLDLDKNEKFIEIVKKIQEIEKSIKLIPSQIGLEQIFSDINALKNGIGNCESLQEHRDHKEMTDNMQREIKFLKDQLDDYINGQNDHEDVLDIKRRVEMLMTKNHGFEDSIEEIRGKLGATNIKSGPIFDPTKYIDNQKFDELKKQIIKEFNGVNDNFSQFRKILEEMDNTLKNKTTFKDLKSLEDDLLLKLEEQKINSNKRFADKLDTTKNIKYLDQQMKHIISIYIKKFDKNEATNWLIAKKPLNNGNLCASCESYLGDLKDNSPYIPWNKYPNKENGEKLYRFGAGFSKMLQMVNVDENDKAVLEKNNNLSTIPNSSIKEFNDVLKNDNSLLGINAYKDNKKNLPKVFLPTTAYNKKFYNSESISPNERTRTENSASMNNLTNINQINPEEDYIKEENSNNKTIEEIEKPKITKIIRLTK